MAAEEDAAARKAFAAAAIAALTEARAARLAAAAAPPPRESLARAAHAKLQYDFPVLSAAELVALREALEEALAALPAPPARPITQRLLANVIAGATPRPAGGPTAPQQHQQTNSGAASPGAASAAAEGGESGGGEEAAAAAAVVEEYRRIAALLVLRLPARLLELPESAAAAALCDYCPPPAPAGDEEEGEAPAARPLAAGRGSDSDDDVAMARAFPAWSGDQDGGTGVAGPPPALAAADDAAAAEAAQPDDDETPYEALEAAAPAPAAAEEEEGDSGGADAAAAETDALLAALFLGGGGQAAQAVAPPPQATVLPKLLHLAAGAPYAALASEAAWAEGRGLETALRAVRAASALPEASRAGSPAAGLAAALSTLAAERMAAAAGADLEHLEALWEALGAQQALLLHAPAAAGGSGDGCGLPPAARQALAVSALLAARLAAAAAPRERLWRAAQRSLLPIAASALEALAAALPGFSDEADATVAVAAPPQLGDDAALACGALEFLLLNPPRGAGSVGRQLAIHGALIPLGRLFASSGAGPAAEPLRRALLLAAASHADVAAHVVRMTHVRDALAHPAFAPGAAAEAHGAVWPLVLPAGGDTAAAAAPEPAAAAVALLAQAAGGGETGRPPAWARLHGLLALLADAYAASAPGPRPLRPPPPLEGALRALAVELQRAAAAAEAAPPEGAREGSDGGADDRGRGAEALERRRAQRMRPACLRLVKRILTAGQGGKSD